MHDEIKIIKIINNHSNNWKPSRDGRRYVACDLELWPIKIRFVHF